MTGYNGWKNWETWTMSLFATNDEQTYHIARRCKSWTQFANAMIYYGITHNQDGVHMKSKQLAFKELTSMIKEFNAGN